MNEADRKDFASVLRATMEVYDKKLSQDALKVWWATMKDVSLHNFREAMTAHITTSQFAPKPADILGQFRKQDGRPGAEEAWGMIPKNEIDSVVWTTEMAAAYGAAAPLLNDGDKIGARMAFKEAYEKEVERAAKEGLPPKWIPSFGFDKSGREAALQEAVCKNRLTADKALKLIPYSETLMNLAGKSPPQISHEGAQEIRRLMSGKAPEEQPPDEGYDENALLEDAKGRYPQGEPA